jgi:raffinose/stachyose/melibiose transport system substrate-binding protein
MYVRSFATGRGLFDSNFIADLTDLPGLQDNFAPEMLAPWSTEDGETYAVPFIAVSHGVYYNKDLFNELGIAIPTTWEELIAAAQTLKDNGYDGFANASGDTWTIAEIVFMNLAPNFIGGREGRLAYMKGERCFNDEHVVAAFQAVADIAPFVPADNTALTYYDSQQIFLQGEAGMWMGGSWDIPVFEAENPDFEWGVFATPAPAGQEQQYLTFHLDAGLGMNAATEHPEEARAFLEWMTTPEAAGMLNNLLPGFFSINKNAPAPSNPPAAEFFALNEGRETDVRWAWELLGGSPDGYTLMQDNAIAVLNGEETPQQAADALQEGLAQWYEPAKACGM